MAQFQPQKSIFKRWWFWLSLMVVILGLVLFFFLPKNNESQVNNNNENNNGKNLTPKTYWRQNKEGWEAVGTPPACPEPLILSVGDITQATSVLYPGQIRSVGYEPTAGFLFNNSKQDEITLKAPLDGEIVQGARFYANGEIQYVFDILSPCGIMNRFDHLSQLPTDLQVLADKLPAPKEGDSRSTSINPPFTVSKGDTIATAVGVKNNTYISWTVFDFRHKNKISENQDWAATYSGLYHFAICPYQYMTTEDQMVAKKLPAADMTSGDKSDFCNGIWP